MIQLLGTLVDKSIVTVSFPSADARYDVLDTVREYALERLAASGGLAAARKAHAEYYATVADAARGPLRGPEWRSWIERLELEHDNLWAALTYAHEGPDADIAGRLGTLAWYFTLAERVSEGRRFVELALAAIGEDAPAALRLELTAFLCYLATEELDLEAAIEAGERGLGEYRAVRRSRLSPRRRSARPCPVGRLRAGGRAGREGAGAPRDDEEDWTIAATSLLHGQVAASTGDVSTVAAMAARRTGTPTRSGSTRFRSALLLEAWVADRRGDRGAAADAYQRVRARGTCRVHGSRFFALAGLGWNAFVSGDLRDAEASSGGRSPPRRRHGRRGPRRTRAFGWRALPPPATPAPPRRCTATCSSRSTSPARTDLARASSWRLPKTRARSPGPASTTSSRPSKRTWPCRRAPRRQPRRSPHPRGEFAAATSGSDCVLRGRTLAAARERLVVESIRHRRRYTWRRRRRRTR